MKVGNRWRALSSALLLVAAAVVHGQQPQTGFVPLNELPPSEQIPAAPLVIAAYAFVWIALLFYVWSVWRRLVRVEGELTALEHRVNK